MVMVTVAICHLYSHPQYFDHTYKKFHICLYLNPSLRTMNIYGGEPSFLYNCIELGYEFLNLRAWYWFFSSLMKKGSSELADVLIARVAFSNIDKRSGEFPFVVLDDYLKNEDGCLPAPWETFLDFVSRFYKRLSMAKYSIINLGGILFINERYLVLK